MILFIVLALMLLAFLAGWSVGYREGAHDVREAQHRRLQSVRRLDDAGTKPLS